MEVDRELDVIDVVRESDARSEPLLVLGGGSNLVVSDEGFPGTVLRLATRGIEVRKNGARMDVTVAAGEPWDGFVATAVEGGLAGVECLAGIPGLTGAVPMQNVGAYGQDVSKTITAVRVWDRESRRVVSFDRASCQFAYRTSVFRGKTRHVILDVTFELEPSGESCPIRYAELSNALGIGEGERAPAARVRETVIALRRKKGMVLDPNDADTTSAGSFFTNPILDADALTALKDRVSPVLRKDEVMPTFAEPNAMTKVSAAWLIERAGFGKGFQKGDVAISRKHALALTNRGSAKTADLLAMARTIRDGVRERFGVTLENEPVLVGASL